MLKKEGRGKIKVIFLDRDGVINRYPGHGHYVTNLKEFKLFKSSLTAIKKLFLSGYKIYVVSNQAGVGKGVYSKAMLEKITEHMLKEVKKSGGRIEKTLYCTHLHEHNCLCRKPKDGLLRKAVRGRIVDMENTYFIGDSLMDVKAGKNFGCKTILVFSGREKIGNSPQWDTHPDFVAKTLLDAVNSIIAGKYQRA